MPTRSQAHKQRMQGAASDGSTLGGGAAPVIAVPLVDQTSSNNVADTYTFAAGSFTVTAGGMHYGAQSVVGGIAVPLVAGITFNPLTRTFNWTKPTGTYIVRVSAQSDDNKVTTDDFNIVVT